MDKRIEAAQVCQSESLVYKIVCHLVTIHLTKSIPNIHATLEIIPMAMVMHLLLFAASKSINAYPTNTMTPKTFNIVMSSCKVFILFFPKK